MTLFKKMNHKLLVILITMVLVTVSVVSITEAFADVISPKKQTEIGIDQTDIICKANLVKVYRTNTDSVSCFKPSSAEKLISNGLAKEIPKDRLEAKKSFSQNLPVGTTKDILTIRQFATPTKQSSELRANEYLHIFEVCAKEKTIRAPEVLIKSDSEVKNIKLAQKIMANECYTNSAKIKAGDPNSVSTTLSNKGFVTDELSKLEGKVKEIQQKIATAKMTLSEITKNPTNLGNESKRKISETTDEIVKLREDLNLAKGELNKYLFVLHLPQQLKASDFIKPKLTLTGMPLKDTSTNIITVTKQVTGSGTQDAKQTLHNVVFEACSGNEVIRVPEVKITSDTEQKTIKVSEKIIANSCLMSMGKINANDPASIKLEVANRSDISMKITELEGLVGQLSDEQRSYQMELNKLVVQSEKPADFEQKVTELSNKIIDLRNKLKDAKLQLYGTQYEVYKKP